LSTMQNQPFFNQKQNTQMISWLSDAVIDGEPDKKVAAQKPDSQASARAAKDIEKLQQANAALAEELAKLKRVQSAVMTLQTFKPPKPTKGEGKGKDTVAKEEAGKMREKRERKPRERRSSKKAPTQVCVCGGGNAVHVMSALTPFLLPNTKLHILTTFSDEAERWNKELEKNGKMVLTKAEHDKTSSVIEGKPTLITKDPAEAVPGSDVIFLPLPAFAHQGYLEAIAPHVSDGATIVGMPQYPGFMWLLKKVLGEEKAAKVKLVGSDTLPWAARLTSYGATAEVIGTKTQMLGCCSERSTLVKPQLCIGRYPRLLYGSGITADLMTTNPYIHLSIMYAQWSRWDGKPLDAEPLFYQGADEFGADIMSKMCDEVVVNTKDAILKLKPELDLSRVVHIYQWYLNAYKEQTDDTSSLLKCLQTNQGYRGLKHPLNKTDDGKWVPNYSYRYMTEDLPMGLVPLRAIAKMAGVETPTTDMVLEWCQKVAGKEYLVEGELTGKDIAETRAPANFGITTIEQMIW